MFVAPISRMTNRLADSVNVYTNGNEAVAAEARAALKSTKNFHIENRRIKSLDKDPAVDGPGGVLVTLEDGDVNKEGFIVNTLSFFFFTFFSTYFIAVIMMREGLYVASILGTSA